MKQFLPTVQFRPVVAQHRAVLAASVRARHGVYLGHDARGWRFTAPQQSVLVLGPPRSGKTTSIIIPNVLAGSGAVVSTSTKPDVMRSTGAARSTLGRCFLFDPTGTVERPDGVEPLRWSPLRSCTDWTGALTMARALVDVGSPGRGNRGGENNHWVERSQALLAPLMHAAALDGEDMRTLLTWVDRRQSLPAQQILAGGPHQATALARNLLDGIVSTDERELSGIWSTASGALGGFRSDQALDTTVDPDFDPAAFVAGADTVYIASPAHRQALVAPMVVGLIEDIRQAAYARSAVSAGEDRFRPPVLLALDEVANIAPLPDLPAMISEGGGQGLVTIACLQDLSQARNRWSDRADGFPSLFGTTVVLPGIGDVRTLEALSTLVGDEEIPLRTVSTGRSLTDRPMSDLVTGGRPHVGESVSTQWRRRLPADVIGRGSSDHALAFDERNQVGWIPLARSYRDEPWRSLSLSGQTIERVPGRPAPGLGR